MSRELIRVINLSRGTVLAAKTEVAASCWSRGRGLLGRSSLPPGRGLLIYPCNSVHTMGMAFPIDVLHLNRRREVLRILTLYPWRLGPLVLGGHYVLEIPAGTAGSTVPGDHLEFVPG